MRYLMEVDSRIKVDKAEELLDLPVYISFSGAFTEESQKVQNRTRNFRSSRCEVQTGYHPNRD